MVKIIMNGCNGRMGQFITKLAKEDDGVQIVAGVDLFDGIVNDYPVFKCLKECNIDADVLIDFTAASVLSDVIEFCSNKCMPAVICSTGYSDEQIKNIKDLSSKVAVLKSANMSLGVNVLLKLIKEAAKTLSKEGFDIEIVEKHHNQKKDAPSGTALALADSINEACDNCYEYIYDRSQRSAKREAKELGISAVRGGTIVGEHDIIFAGEDEVITFEHSAYSRAIFAKGALSAAKFLAGKPAGMYDMQDVIG